MCVFLDRNSNHLAIDIILQVCLVLKQIDLIKHLWEYQTSEYKQESCFRLEQDSASAPRLSVRDCWCWGVWSTAVLLFILCMTVTDSDNGLHVESRPSRRYYRELSCVSIGGSWWTHREGCLCIHGMETLMICVCPSYPSDTDGMCV